MRAHLDTDLGGDTDDACALALLLGWAGVEVVGVTTVSDRGARPTAPTTRWPTWAVPTPASDDLLNFQYDPVACAVAAGWPGAVVERQRLHPVVDGEVLGFPPASDGRPVRVVVDLDGTALAEAFLDAVEAAQQPPTSNA